jgi:phosphoribosylformylglycinamidine synthase subunit PurQ / glutaminase
MTKVRSKVAGQPTVAVLYAPGINCHEETAFVLDSVGLDGRIVNIHDALTGEDALTRYQAVVLPGGFSWGDHLGAGRILGVHLVARLADQLASLVQAGKPVLGICNGFQVLVETGLVPNRTVGHRGAALLQNRSAVFESRWVDLVFVNGSSLWTRGLEGRVLRMPVAHGEGRLYWEERDSVNAVVYYAIDGRPTEEYPSNPNGTPGGVAGICDSTGLIFGLMPHPERACLPWHGSTDGRLLFENLAEYLTSACS